MANIRTLVVLHDLGMIALAWALAWWVRFNFHTPPPANWDSFLLAWPVVVMAQGGVAWYFRLYRGLWRFASLRDLGNIVFSAALGALCILLVLFTLTRLDGVPRTVFVLYPIFLIILLGGPRLFYRLLKDRTLNLRRLDEGERVLIIGAGTAAETLLRDILRQGSYSPAGLLDDNTSLMRQRIHGVPVLGAIDDLPALAMTLQIKLILIAIPSATNAQMQRVVELCERTSVPFRTLPRLQGLMTGPADLGAVREVAIDDLLGRSAVALALEGVRRALAGQIVLVTGGGGSIGAELCRQLAGIGVARLVIFERNEHNLYLIDRELGERFPEIARASVLGDVCDDAALRYAFQTYCPTLVFHAAAYKHVPMVEAQIREGVRNNVLGTTAVAAAAVRYGTASLVLISTDKAVRPSSVMGATKRLAEMVCEWQNQRSASTRFVTVRFGNVLGSAGSVVPLFREQIARGGPVTVTHPEVTRYFMTIPEAAQLILQATIQGQGGDILVLDMGTPVNITYLAEQMIRLSGKVPGADIPIIYTGLRPGEKLHEELFHVAENLRSTEHPKLLLAAQRALDGPRLDALCQQLHRACDDYDEARLHALLRDLVPDFIQGQPPTREIDQTVLPLTRS